MFLSAESLDDLLQKVYVRLLRSKNFIQPTKGPATELFGVLLRLTNPRARLSRTEKKGTLFSCLGELLWYLARSKSVAFITYYLPGYEKFSDDGKTINGAYGPRIFDKNGIDQLLGIIELLKRKPDSRQAVVQIFDAVDIVNESKDIPCTCTMQFVIRRHRLHMLTTMRSNDAFIGLPHDVFAFTMLQEIVARSLDLEVGTYKHAVGSLHLYNENRADAESFVKEGWQELISMPAMPQEDPWGALKKLVHYEARIRNGGEIDVAAIKVDEYWQDLLRILQIWRLVKDDKRSEIYRIKRKMKSKVYVPYIQKREAARSVPRPVFEQLPLPESD